MISCVVCWKQKIATEIMLSHIKLLANTISAIGLHLDKSSENGHVWSSVIYCKLNTSITFLVEIKSKRTDFDFDKFGLHIKS